MPRLTDLCTCMVRVPVVQCHENGECKFSKRVYARCCAPHGNELVMDRGHRDERGRLVPDEDDEVAILEEVLLWPTLSDMVAAHMGSRPGRVLASLEVLD